MTVYGVQAIITILTHFRASDYTLLAGTVIWLYDILLTLDDEISLLWTKGGCLIKALYLINRYLPAVGLPLILSHNNPFRMKPFSVRRCAIGLAIITSCQAIGTIVATTILIARLYTVFCLNRNIRIFLVLALVISHICILTFTIMLIEGCLRTMSYSDVLRICITNFPKTTGAVYITPIFIESVIAFATLYHACASQYWSTKRQSSVKKILRTLHVDGFLYCVVVLTMRIGTSLVVWVAPRSLIFLLCYFEYAFSSAITSRWFLSFRKVLAESFVSATFPTTMLTTGGKTMSVGAGLELAHRGPSHSATLSASQDPTKPDTYSETREGQ